MLCLVTKYNFDTLHGIYMHSFTVLRALALHRHIRYPAFVLRSISASSSFYHILLSFLIYFLACRHHLISTSMLPSSIYSTFSETPIVLQFSLKKEESLRCHHHHYISFFWCSSFASFSQSFLLFCVDLMFVMSSASCIFTSFRVVYGAWGFVRLLSWKSRFSFRLAFIDTELYHYENRNTDFRA